MPRDAPIGPALVALAEADLQRLAARLIEAATLPSGEVDAQEVGRGQPSLASAGTMLMALAAMPEVADDDLQALVRLCEKAVRADGRLVSASGLRPTDGTTWSSAQLLAGLATRPRLLEDAEVGRRLVRSISERFLRSGSTWTLREATGDTHHPLFGFYPAIALARARAAGWDDEGHTVHKVAERSLRSCLLALKESPPWDRALILLATVDVWVRQFGMRVDQSDQQTIVVARDLLEVTLLSDSGTDFPASTPVVQQTQPLWYAMVDRQFLWLWTRRVWATEHVGNMLALSATLEGFNERLGGWRASTASGTSGIYSWATALGLLAGSLIRRDAAKLAGGSMQLVSRLEEVQMGRHKYDIVISFSGKQRGIAETIARRIQAAGFSVFYDNDRRHELLGEDLSIYLQDVYFSQSRYAVAILSSDFLRSKWASNWEWKAILARMQQQHAAYLLPYFVEQVSVPGLNATIGYIDSATTPDEFADIVIKKLRRR